MRGATVADRAGVVSRLPRSLAVAEPLPAAADLRVTPTTHDAFPHTRRPLPWFLAAFVAMVFLVPIDSTELKVNIGVDSHPDRLAVVVLALGMALVWWRSAGVHPDAAVKAVRRRGLRVSRRGRHQPAARRRADRQPGRLPSCGEALRAVGLVPGGRVVRAHRLAVRGRARLRDVPDRARHGDVDRDALRAPYGLQHLLRMEPRDSAADRRRRSLADSHTPGARHRRPCQRRRSHPARARGDNHPRGGDAVRAGACPGRHLAQILVAERGRLRADGRRGAGDRSQDGAGGAGRGRHLHRLLPPAPSAAFGAGGDHRAPRPGACGLAGSARNRLRRELCHAERLHDPSRRGFQRCGARRAGASTDSVAALARSTPKSPLSSGSTTTSTSTRSGRSAPSGCSPSSG